jgi:RHS repeat-associated protein
MKTNSWKSMLLCVLLLFGASFAYGQRNGVVNFSAADVHDFDTVNLVTLVPTFNIPLVTKSGGPLPTGLKLQASPNCRVLNGGTSYYWLCGPNIPLPVSFLYTIPSEMIGMTVGYTKTGTNCITYDITSLIGADGISSYSLPNTILYSGPPGCNPPDPTSATVTTNDGSGYTVTIDTSSGVNISGLSNSSGWTQHYSGLNPGLEDAFGNTITVNYTTGAFTDALGATITPTSSGWSYTDTNGSTQNITETLGSQTNFNPIPYCGGVNYPSTPFTVKPVTSINYPDGTSFGIGWETSGNGISGMINSLKLRTGGTISFSYGPPTNGCNNIVYYSLSRTTPDGTTNYSVSINGNVQTTTVLDPGRNKTVYTFNGPFLTSTTKYQNTGNVSAPSYTLISTVNTCYNTNTTNCANPPSFWYPITQRDTFTYVGTGSKYMSHRTETYDGYGNTLTDATADQITGQTITKTIAYSSCGVTNANIHDHPCTITTTSAGNQIAKKTFTYNSNGALRASTDWISSTDTLTTNYTPNTNGTYASIQAPNGQSTSYTYGNCNGLLRTASSTTVNGVVIGTSQTWDCNGGVVTSTTDANGNEDDTTYDSVFRMASHTDYSEATTIFNYTSNSVKTTDPLGVIRYTYTDSLGRTSISQTQQSSGSSNYDTVFETYGWKDAQSNPIPNFQTQTSVPCVQTLDQPCPTVALTALTNPAVGSVSSSDANGGTLTNGYNANDVSVTAGPAPSGEHVKTVQTETDGLGRPKSVCALETIGGTACGQVMGHSGILNSYSYSFGTGTSTTTVTRGSQVHTTVKDALGRTTSSQTPESGTSTFIYDSSSTCNISNPGYLVDKVDNAGNHICYLIDGLGRLYTTFNPDSQGVWHNCHSFVYGEYLSQSQTPAPPTGWSGTNGTTRIVESQVDYNCNGTWAPVEWFMYDADGRTTDVWESTPHSGGYYHTWVTYNPNGTVASINGIPGYTAYTFGVDGEGRSSTASQGTAILINGVTYDAASRVRTVPIGGSGDKDTFTYDTVERMKNYTFSVNGNVDSGTLVWNPNGTLASLSVNDTFNSGGSQVCAFSYDDLFRLLTDACGAENYIMNAGFESGDTGWVHNSPYTMVNNPSNAQSGSWYLSGSSTSQAGSDATTNGTTSLMPVVPGSLVQYGGWVNRVSGTGYTWWSGEFRDSGGNHISWFPAVGIADRTTPAGWNYYAGSITAPSNAAYVLFYAEIHGAGDPDTSLTTAYFDSAVFSASASLWNQTYTYDQYDNLTKNGNPGTSWTPGYNSINQMIGSSYDADGRLLYDTVNSYSWDAYGKMLGARVGATTPNCGSGGSYCATYDAAGRIVETSNGGTYKEILYGPTGRLALMTGQSVSEADIPLPGGLTLKATGTGGTGSRTILHNDWLGTNRLATSLGNRTWTWDTAYTPYGETYDTFGTPKQDFTGDFQDIFAGLFDTPNRELATNGSRWLSPDPAGASWNAYAYPTDPNRQTDPTGLGPNQEWSPTAPLDTPTTYCYYECPGPQVEISTPNETSNSGKCGGVLCGEAQNEPQNEPQYDPKKSGIEDPTNPGHPLSQNPVVKKASDEAWQKTTNGTARNGRAEAGGTIEYKDGKIFTANKVNSVNDDAQTANHLIIHPDANTIAIYHTHGNSLDPKPSPGDRSPKTQVPDFVRSQRSLYVTIPGSAHGNPSLNDYIQLQ